MLFNSFSFLIIFPIIFLFYWGILILRRNSNPTNYIYIYISNAFLLIASYLLYIYYSPVAAVYLISITAVTYIFARLIERNNAYGNKKYSITSGIVFALIPLLLFKYYNFVNTNLTDVLSYVGINVGLPGLNWAIPLGISFFTFQAIGYLCDVYYRRINAEHNWWHYMLFIGFFPQITSGPISKASELLPQIKSNRQFKESEVVKGAKWLLWGYFLKVVLADNIGILVDSILPNYEHHNGTTLAYASVLYSFQLYGDFAGYSLMAIGVAKMLGFNLINNFCRPYFAVSVTEFWKRWHISLTRWLTTYVYIPLGGNRCSKLKNYFNIFITFLVSGLWHGANWTFLAWGAIHGALQVGEKHFGLQKCENRFIRPFRIIITFILVTIAWVFFRMPTIGDGWNVLKSIFTTSGGLNTGASNSDLFIASVAIITVFIVEWCEEYAPKISLINSKHTIIRWATYITLICTILLFGVLDGGSFIYVSF